MLKNNCGIYKITSPSNKVYVGQAINIKKRWLFYTSSHSKSHQTHLFNSLKKYGSNNHVFEVLHALPSDVTKDIMDNYEILYIEAYIDAGFKLLNMRGGGSHGRHSEETKSKISKTHTGKVLPIETVLKIKETKKKRGFGGWVLSADIRKRMSIRRTGFIVSDSTKAKMTESQIKRWAARKNRGHSDAAKMKISLAHRGRKASNETKNKMSSSLLERWSNKEYKEKLINIFKKAGESKRKKNRTEILWKRWVIANGVNYTLKEIMIMFPAVKKRTILSFCFRNNIQYKKIIGNGAILTKK